MNRPGRIPVGYVVGLAAGAAFLLIVVGLVIIVYPAFVRARGTATLSGKHIDVKMHDQKMVQAWHYYDTAVGCRIRVPSNLETPFSTSFPGAVAAFTTGVRGDVTFSVEANDKKGLDFNSWARNGRLKLQRDEVIDDEGESEINGLKTYVMTAHFQNNGRLMRTRFYLIEGPGGKFYSIAAGAPDIKWSAMADVFDSSASTFEVGTWSPRAMGTRPMEHKVPVTNLPAGGKAISQKPGQAIEVFWGNKWWPAKIVEVEGGKALVQYDGWNESYNEWVTPDRMREKK